jgi:hypothetical protein
LNDEGAIWSITKLIA